MSAYSASPDRAEEKKPSMELREEGNAAMEQTSDASGYVPGSEAEKKLLRKIDMRIIVCLSRNGVWTYADSYPSRVFGVSIM